MTTNAQLMTVRAVRSRPANSVATAIAILGANLSVIGSAADSAAVEQHVTPMNLTEALAYHVG